MRMPELSFSSIGNSFQFQCDLNMLSGRAKVNLLKALFDDMGFTKPLSELPGFEEIWNERTALNWGQEAPMLTIKPRMF